MILKRKIYKKLLEWKNECQGKKALLIEGARRIGKSTICEEFGKNEYESYLLIDFAKKEFAGEHPIFGVSHMRDAETFKTKGFIVSKEWKLYIKMVYPPTYENTEKCI